MFRQELCGGGHKDRNDKPRKQPPDTGLRGRKGGSDPDVRLSAASARHLMPRLAGYGLAVGLMAGMILLIATSVALSFSPRICPSCSSLK